MNTDFWLARWAKNEIGFHQRRINSYLIDYWPQLNVPRDRVAFVPLCGKALDMRWLSETGKHRVLGIEIARKACADFYAEWGVEPEIHREEKFERFSARGVDILCGDFFDLRPMDTDEVGGVFDRAALIALPPSLRERYAVHLQTIVPRGIPILLIAPEYAQSEMSGPPFAVDETEVRHLFRARAVEVLATHDITDHPDNARFRERGVTRLVERVYKIN